MNLVKRRAKRISDRPTKEKLVLEEEKPFLTLAAQIIAEIILRKLDEEDEPPKSIE